MEDITKEMKQISINKINSNVVPNFIRKMNNKQLEDEIRIILQSDQRYLFNTQNMPQKINKETRQFFENELYNFLRKLENY